MGDLISRQAAIDAIKASASKYTGFMGMEMYNTDDAVEAIIGVPSAQSERSAIENQLHGLTPENQLAFLRWFVLDYGGPGYMKSYTAQLEWLKGNGQPLDWENKEETDGRLDQSTSGA